MPLTGPKQTVIISSRGNAIALGQDKEYENLFTTYSHMVSSNDPPMYSISIPKDRHSYELIKNSNVFCVNFLTESHKDLAPQIQNSNGKHIDKFKHFNVIKSECDLIDCPKIADAVAHLECEVHSHHEVGNHYIITGKILKGYKNSNIESNRRLFNIGKFGKDNFTGI